MQLKDRIYGKINIDELVVLELIESPTLKRLKDIDQAGYFFPFFPNTERSRYEHSLGVYTLLNRYNTSLEEQIAGLIHDVSHSAFSHCIDYILNAGSQKDHSHQDNIFDDYVKKSEIPVILKKHGLDVDYILNDRNFPLKENNLPDLCADRIDYSLRVAVTFKEIDQEKAIKILSKLKVEDNKWFFIDYESAREYAELFFKLNENYHAGIHSALMFNGVGETMHYALKKGYITEDDLYQTDKIVLQKVRAHLEEDERLSLLYDRMNNKVGYKDDKQDYDIHIFCKSRVVDPLCKYKNQILRVSDIDRSWREVMKNGLVPKEYFIKYEK